MKQHITIDQLNELSEKGKERLREWWKPSSGDLFSVNGFKDEWWVCINGESERGLIETGCCECDDARYKVSSLPLLSVGQMIEFLGTDGFANLYDGTVLKVEELCDALWEAIKEVLNAE